MKLIAKCEGNASKNNMEKWTYPFSGRGIVKKVLIGFSLLLLIITISFVLLSKNSNDSTAVNAEELEKALSKSMEETEKDKELLDKFFTETAHELHNKGLQVGLSFSFEERSLTVQAKDQTYIDVNRSSIEKIIYNKSKEIGFKNFKVDFLALDSRILAESEDEEQIRKSTMKVYEEISALLEEKGYHYNSLSTNMDNEIIIELQGNNADLENSEKIEEFEKLIDERILSKTDLNFTVNFKRQSENAIRDQEWQPIFTAIIDETNKKFEEYRGFAYSFHPAPLQIIIKTKLDSPSWFSNSDEKVNQITEYVEKIIELKRKELSIEEIPYKIIVRDKNNKKLN
ncbi:hypothetical protein [Ureibacillus chungkukjangi]|uniref:hypothetical protein n=1 Tax=Ureibacillus chungkukjangi TaxID=1202712 RepID=UPI00203CF657